MRSMTASSLSNTRRWISYAAAAWAILFAAPHTWWPGEAGTEGTAREVRFMLRIWVHRVRPGKEARLRTWLAELNMRAGEVRESFRIAGIRAEQAALVSSGDGSLLVYVSDAEDQRQAAQAFEESQSAIDAEHRRVLAECIEETLDATPLYDVSG